MKINNRTLFSIILICFALVGKCMSHGKPSPTPPESSSSPTPPESSSSPTPPESSSSIPPESSSSSTPPESSSSSTPPESSSSTPPESSSSTPPESSSSTPPESSSSTPPESSSSTPPSTSTSTPSTSTPSTSTPSTSTPSTSTPSTPLPNSGRKTKISSSYYSEANDQSSELPFIDPPSGSPFPTKGSATFGYSSSFSASFSDYLRAKHGDRSKIKYNPSLQQICSRTHHADVCLATISPMLKHKFDAIHVLEASIIVCTQNLKAIVARIEKHVVVSHAVATSLLIECQKHYTKALMNLHKALKAIHARNFVMVTKMLSAAVADVSTAESKIMDLKINTFKVEYFSFVSFTASNCLSIASLVPN